MSIKKYMNEYPQLCYYKKKSASVKTVKIISDIEISLVQFT